MWDKQNYAESILFASHSFIILALFVIRDKLNNYALLASILFLLLLVPFFGLYFTAFVALNGFE